MNVAADGVGPNRVLRKKVFRGKYTCDNAGVPISEVESRLTIPEGFSGVVCQMDKDSHEGPFLHAPRHRAKRSPLARLG